MRFVESIFQGAVEGEREREEAFVPMEINRRR